MNHKNFIKAVAIITLPIIFLPLILLLIYFGPKISTNLNDWALTGTFISGSIGVIFSIVASVLLYQNLKVANDQLANSNAQLAIAEQGQVFLEVKFFIDAYHVIVANIKENFLHQSPEKYNHGKEIFGNVLITFQITVDKFPNETRKTLYPIAISNLNDETKNHTYIESEIIWGIDQHLNVFYHYTAFIENAIKRLKVAHQEYFLISYLSYYEKFFLAFYFTIYRQKKGLPEDYELARLLIRDITIEVLDADTNETHQKVCKYIYRRLTASNEK